MSHLCCPDTAPTNKDARMILRIITQFCRLKEHAHHGRIYYALIRTSFSLLR